MPWERNKKLFRISRKIMKNLFYTILFLLYSHNIVFSQTNFLVFSSEQISSIKTAVRANDQEIKPFVGELREIADFTMDKGPWSVTFHRGKAISENPHDYYSESPYWWPNPEKPDGPYIRKDGLRNPERFMAHKNGLLKMSQSVAILSMAGYFFDDPEYTDRARYLLKVWFIDDATRMNPHLDYGQAIPNKSTGRGVGIIDTHRLAKLISTFGFLEASGRWPESEKEELKKWFMEYLEWLLTSKNGTDEKKQGNNHSTWWAVQVASYAGFTENSEILEMIWDYARNTLIEQQISPDGRFPLEEKRTRSYDYSLFNLNAFSLLFRIAQIYDVNLWNVNNSNGAGIITTMNYLYPYLTYPSSWPGEQIISRTEREPFSIIFVGEYTKQQNYIDLYKKKRKVRNINSVNNYDPFVLLINLYSCTL